MDIKNAWKYLHSAIHGLAGGFEGIQERLKNDFIELDLIKPGMLPSDLEQRLDSIKQEIGTMSTDEEAKELAHKIVTLYDDVSRLYHRAMDKPAPE